MGVRGAGLFASMIKSLETLLEGFPGGSASKESVCNAGDLGSIPGLAKVGSQEIPGVTGKFGLGVQNEAGKG